MQRVHVALCVFFFNDTATTEIYTLSLHDALPISTVNPSLPQCTSLPTLCRFESRSASALAKSDGRRVGRAFTEADRKSTRLNSSHANISYAVFCLTKKTVGIILATSLYNTNERPP